MIVDGESTTFAEMLDHLAECRTGQLAFVADDHSQDAGAPLRCTYDQLARDVQALHAALAERGIEPGDRVAVMLSSVPEWIRPAAPSHGATIIPSPELKLSVQEVSPTLVRPLGLENTFSAIRA